MRNAERTPRRLLQAGVDEPKYVRKTRKNADGETKYLLENVPRALMTRAKAKAHRRNTAVKWVLIKLLEQWVNGERTL